MPYKGKQSLTSVPKVAEVYDEWYLFDLHHNVNTDSMNAFIKGSYKLGKTVDGKFVSYKDENGQEVIREIIKNDFFGFIKENVLKGNKAPKDLMDGIVVTMGTIADEEGLFNLD